jgi:hypothetical protein
MSDSEVQRFLSGRLCPRGAATAQAAVTYASDCDLSEYDDLESDLGQAIAKFDVENPGFFRYIASLDKSERKLLYEFADSGVGDVSGSDIVVRFWKADQNSDDVLSPVEAVKKIEYFKQKAKDNGEDFEFGDGWETGLVNSNPGKFKGTSYELELAARIDRQESGSVVALGKKVDNGDDSDSDGDVWVDETGDGEADKIIEAKNYNFDGKYEGDSAEILFGYDFNNKIDIYSDAINRGELEVDEVVVSFRADEDEVTESVIDEIERAEDEYDEVNVDWKGDSNYASSTQERIEIRISI